MSKENRDLVYETLYAEAVRRGQDAGEQCIPVPMVVEQHVNPLDDNSPVRRSWEVSDGVCGFAWVLFPDCRKPFVKWLLDVGHAGKRYGKPGATIWIMSHNQSMARKMAHATTMRDYFASVGIECSSHSMID